MTDITSSDTSAQYPAVRPGGVGAALLRRWPTALGIAFAGLLAALAAVLPEGLFNDSAALAGAALVYLVWSVVRRDLVALQIAGMVFFGGVALVALALDPPLGTLVIAGGWLAHAVWDLGHHRANRAVARWYAEACGVTDILITAGLVALVLF